MDRHMKEFENNIEDFKEPNLYDTEWGNYNFKKAISEDEELQMINYSQCDEKMNTSNINHYLQLLKMTYKEAVEKLKARVECKYDYFNRQSFENLAKNDFKSKYNNYRKPNHNKNRSKYSEGLFLHHVYENKVSNLSYLSTLRKYPIFMYQEKENLVYCNLVEHLILHALIAKETNNQLGLKGYNSILEQVKDLYSKARNDELNNKEIVLLEAIGLDDQNYESILALIKTLVN